MTKQECLQSLIRLLSDLEAGDKYEGRAADLKKIRKLINFVETHNLSDKNHEIIYNQCKGG